MFYYWLAPLGKQFILFNLFNYIAFRAAGQPLGQLLADAVGGNLHIAGTLSIDRWGGGEKVGLRIMDAARPE